MNLKIKHLGLFCIFLTAIASMRLSAQKYGVPQAGDLGCVQFFREGNTLSFPIIDISSRSKLELRFDVFGVEDTRYFYSIELCDYDWTKVDVDAFDYLDGNDNYYFDAYGHSVNTLVRYNHYRLYLPNDDLSFLMPGNYLLKVYKDYDKQNLLMTKRFVVFEEMVGLTLTVDDYQSRIYDDRQEVLAEIEPDDVSLHELAGNTKLLVLQNNNWETSQIHEKYSTNGQGNLVFDMPGQITFLGGNEFRFFDMKSFKFISERVQYMDYIAPAYHVYLKHDKLRGDKKYFSRQDLNGMFFISNQETNDPDTLDAEYAYVHFYLDTGVPLPEEIFIEGAITDWDHDKNYMTFNPETGLYEKDLYLKQGLYNYRYVSKEYGSKKVMRDITEGNYYETKNNYLGIVYYRSLGSEYYSPIAINIMETEF